MWPFKRQRPVEQVKGELRYFGLAEWWLVEFSPAERRYIEAVYQPMGLPVGSRPLSQGEFRSSTGNAVKLLNGLASWFRKLEDRHLARHFLLKAESITQGIPAFDRHLTYHGLIENSYKDRDSDPAALDRAIAYCERQIALAPEARKDWQCQFPRQPLPSHTGYNQLAIIREKQGDFKEAIALATAAKKQGWSGDWDKRIARCEARLARGKSISAGASKKGS